MQDEHEVVQLFSLQGGASAQAGPLTWPSLGNASMSIGDVRLLALLFGKNRDHNGPGTCKQ